MEDIIVIVGPTGVGKTKLSIELAKKLDAEIINGDSVAIYKELNIGSAKPTLVERDGIVHHLIDIRNVCEEYSVFDYQRDVRSLIKQISNRGKRIIIVGGTGLYIKAALYDYRFTEGTLTKQYDELTNQELYDRICQYDDKVNIHPNNRQRMVRFLNKLENGEDFSNEKDCLLYPVKVIGLTTERTKLYERINRRVDKMLADGLFEEVMSLEKYYVSSRILKSAIGYKEFLNYFQHSKSLEEVIEQIKLDSRRFAKRQYTFFHHQFDVDWYDVNFDNFDETIEKIYCHINKKELL